MSSFFIFSIFFLLFPHRSSSQSATNATVQCPLDFTVLGRLAQGSKPPSGNFPGQCQFILQGLRLVQSYYLRSTNNFLPPLNSAESCWQSYQSLYNQFIPNFNIRSNCGFQTGLIVEGCHNITTLQQYVSYNDRSTINAVISLCTLQGTRPCAKCTTAVSVLQPSDFNNQTDGNASACTAFKSMYAGAIANSFGPNDRDTALCLFSLRFDSSNSSHKHKSNVIYVVVVVGVVILLLGFGRFLWFIRIKLKRKKREREIAGAWANVNQSSDALNSISSSTAVIKFTFDEIKEATKNFSRLNMVGRGGYGNVYKGVLPDGTEVAVKRFKNCAAAGDTEFAHEVEVIASVLHVNLVALRGYCIATTEFEGHQRIIVCDLVNNGNLYDHLFGKSREKLSWPIRHKIALGTARGLAYLHYGAQPAIIHRDIKGSNILLDESFEPKVADFGLAKFAPEGVTHMSTKVAGTMGYVAPEYALYGQLTERSDVYSFGVVLLELLSGKKALLRANEEQQYSLLTDWAWSLVREGRTLDVIEDGLPEMGLPEAMERFVLLAVLCSHPQLYARPTMDQVLKIMETDLPVPKIPERPIPLTADLVDIEKSVSSSG